LPLDNLNTPVGGYAIAGRGPRPTILIARSLMAAVLVATIAGALLGGEPRLGAVSPSGAYLVLTFVIFSALLAWACAIPHLPALHTVNRER
jgi:hypothetical protein